MHAIRLIPAVALAAILTSCQKQDADQVSRLSKVASIASTAINAKDSSSSDSYSELHCEYNQTSIIDLQFDTKDDAFRISSAIKEELEKSGCEVLMYNSHATVCSGNKSWSGGIESWQDPSFGGDSHGRGFGASSGGLVEVEKLYVSCIVRYNHSLILLHCRLFPEEHRVHFTTNLIKQG